MKYKIGDKVRVRSDLVINYDYGDCDFIEDMIEYKGNLVTICECNRDSYHIKEDGGYWFWTGLEILTPISSDAFIGFKNNKFEITNFDFDFKQKGD